jgi:hypothetical protein
MIYHEWEEVLYMNRYLLVILTAYPKITGIMSILLFEERHEKIISVCD